MRANSTVQCHVYVLDGAIEESCRLLTERRVEEKEATQNDMTTVFDCRRIRLQQRHHSQIVKLTLIYSFND